ncbi:VWA domain-containing protein [Glaciihabitans arcticus]|uniref:VWA domain-containing protein n=1 Tax=Glaciihabitans arcticus TaxID=2668039 RepID=A0A4V2JEP8_9MICO|nr:VWA domain-containing protein [Glaciihabitans arcticus]TBN56359.1 VWA domain-containing protein [Glaciihabitans arcticus]
MEVIFWWMPLLWLLVIAGVVAVLLWLRRKRAGADSSSLPIANSERLTSLPGYARALRRYRALLAGVCASIVILLLVGIGLTMRFASVDVRQPELKSRDIVLCLDVSGSMIDYDSEVVDVFSDLADEFEGERISLVIFNASAVTYFPLTSDYDYIQRQFAKLQEEFVSPDQSYYEGTLIGDGSSLVGDGLASCATKFDAPDDPRSRSVILVTDNLIAGEQIFTLPEAGQLAADRNVRVYGINPGDSSAKSYLDELATEFKQVVEATGGGYFALEDPENIPAIVDAITAEQAALMKGPVQLVRTDEPGFFVLLAFLGVAGLFVLAWRLRR